MPNLKQGYKYTEEFGYIPEDWDVKSFDETFSFLSTNAVTREELVEEGVIKNIHYGDILVSYPSILNSCDIKTYIGNVSLSNLKYAKNGDIIIADTAEDETVGRAVELKGLKDNEKVVSGMHTMFCRPKDVKSFASGYLGYFINSDVYHNQLLPLITGIKVSSISKSEIKTTMVIVPEYKEQQKIAEVLGDIDSLIEATQKLINKKKDIKTATMQKLLTPKEDWKEYVIGNLGSTYSGLSGKKKDDFGTGKSKYITFLNIMNNVVIDTTQFENVIIQNNENQNRCMKNDLFFNTSSETPEEVGMCATLQDDISNLYLNSFCFGYRLTQQNIVNPRFFAYIFRTHYGRTIMQTLAQGSTRYNLAKDKFMEYKILLPEYLEQNKTTLVLSDMDSEIEALEKELSKYKDLKIGMMQQLLTGKVRLV